MTMVTLGPYQLNMVDGYITNLQHHWVMDLIATLGPDPDIEWDDFNHLHCAFPDETNVFFYDQVGQPQGWDVNAFGPWFPRRIVCASLKSRHTSNDYRILIEFIPTHDNNGEPIPLPENFVNPFGFTQEGLDRIVGYGCRMHCKVGLRQAGCCCHIAAILVYLGIYSFDSTGFITKHKVYNLADPTSTELPASLARQQFAQ